ncbi:MAG TPA: hypothetical protein VIC62_14615 [Nakamurella sp.]
MARETGDADLEVSALSDLGGRLVGAGQVREGLTLLDEAMAAALAGECARLETVVWVSCTMLGACEAAADLVRTWQWLQVIDEFADRYGCPFMYATCRTHYGSLPLAKGRAGTTPSASWPRPSACRPGRSGAARSGARPDGRPTAAAGPDRGDRNPAQRLPRRPARRQAPAGPR